MEKQYYMPAPNPAWDLWMQTFSAKLPIYATKYGITAEEQDDAKQITADFHYRLTAAAKVDGYSKQWNAYRNALRFGVPEGSDVQPPVAPTLSPAPVAAPGGMARIANIVAKIKNNPAYSVADGKDMGIEGAEIVVDPNKLQPELKAFNATGGRPGIRWVKGHTDGLVIYKDEGNGYKKYDTDIHPDYEDKAPLPEQAKVWKYKCMYLFHGEEAGQWSNEVTFNVGA